MIVLRVDNYIIIIILPIFTTGRISQNIDMFLCLHLEFTHDNSPPAQHRFFNVINICYNIAISLRYGNWSVQSVKTRLCFKFFCLQSYSSAMTQNILIINSKRFCLS